MLEAPSTEVGHHDGMIASKVDRQGRPHVARLAIAMQQDDGRAASADAHMEGGAVGGYVLRAEFWRELEGVHDDLQCH
jgi:hypothetical protein